MNEKNKRTELSALGEFGLIKHLTQYIELKDKSTLKGVGDDAAVIDHGDKLTVVSTDMLLEGIHFDLTYMPLKHLGHKAAIVNLSDIYAMNARPTQMLISLGLSNRFSLEAIEEIYAGMQTACENHQVDIVGGDTNSSLSGLTISITVIGEAKEEDIVYRSGAKEGDLLCVSGDLGGAYIGLQLLEREKAIFKENPNIQPDLKGYDYVLQKQLKPEARRDIPQLLRDLKVKATSMIDVSDGLASEILHLCDQSDVGCTLYEDKIPIDQVTYNTAREFELDPTLCALSGGEDYELLFTLDLADYDKIKNNPDISVIGHITDKSNGNNMIAKDSSVHAIIAQGWDALKK